MLIRELERDTGLERATIRFYEREGFITPHREENGYRTYSDEDKETLLKIKLLRQLGMPLEMIRGLQQGSEDFHAALSDQIQALEHQIQDAGRAKEVCVELRDAGATYQDLDAAHYLHELTRVRPAEPAWKPQTVPEFRQVVVAHPWRRYFAREIDILILNVVKLFLLVVVFRIRPMNSWIYAVFGLIVCIHLMWIPIEALMLHYWGTTPGKWIMGIRVESVNGGPLTISDAMHRAWNVFRYGYGFTIPLYSLWRQYKSYKEYVDYGYVPWDQEWDADIQFRYYYGTKKKVLIGVLAAVFLFMYGIVLNDSVLPKNRGEDLTISQIAENHNDYLEDLYEDRVPPETMYLNNNGQWRSVQYGGNVILIGSTVVGGNANYVFTEENGYVRSITFDQTWSDIFALQPIGTRPICTVMAIAGAQEWMNLPRYYEFGEELSKALQQSEGDFVYENLEISWNIECENCVNSSGTYFSDNEKMPSSLTLHFVIEIHETN